MKKFIFVILSAFILFAISANVFAQREIGNYGVDVSLALDYFTAKKVRNAECTITDSGRFKQGYDTVKFNDLYDGQYDLDTLYTVGYRTLVVEIEIEMKEIDKGYQYLFIYDDATSTTWQTGCKYSLGGGTKVTTFTPITFYFELNLANITNNNFVIRYGASGDSEDNWVNRNVSVYVGASKEEQKTQCM